MARVLVTRAAEDARVLSAYLARAGLDPVEVPLLQRLWQVEEVARTLHERPPFDVLLLTSATAVDVLAAAWPHGWDGMRVAAVGPSTAHRAEQVGLSVHVMPGKAVVEQLLDLLGDVRGARILYPRADLASPLTVEVLRQRGAEVVDVVAYRNIAPRGYEERLLQALPVDATTLMSGSAARRIADATPRLDRLGSVVAIGPSTAAAARHAGLPVHYVASPHTVPGIVAAVRRLFP